MTTTTRDSGCDDADHGRFIASWPMADEMGLGKTIQTISLITYLIEKKKQAHSEFCTAPCF